MSKAKKTGKASAKKKLASAPKKKITRVVRSENIPVTKQMLFHVRSELRAKFDDLQSQVKDLDAKLTSEFHRLAVLIEEQNARNFVVLDGLTALFHRQERVERRLDEIQK